MKGGRVSCSRAMLFEFLEGNHDLKGLWMNSGARFGDFVTCCRALDWFDFPKRAAGFDVQSGTLRRVMFERFGAHVSLAVLRVAAAYMGVPFRNGGSRFEFLFPLPQNRSAMVYIDEFFISESKENATWRG